MFRSRSQLSYTPIVFPATGKLFNFSMPFTRRKYVSNAIHPSVNFGGCVTDQPVLPSELIPRVFDLGANYSLVF